MTVTGSVVKEWALTIKEQPEGIDLTTLPSYDGGQEIEGVLLFMNTITIQPAKSRHGTPNNPVRYELRIEVGSASPPPLVSDDERSGNIATHVIRISDYGPSREKTDFGLVEFIKGCEFATCAPVCLLGEQ